MNVGGVCVGGGPDLRENRDEVKIKKRNESEEKQQ